MKLLIVAMPESVHTARWILQLLDQGWTIYLFPSSFYKEPHPLLRNRVDLRFSWARLFGAKVRPGMIHVCGPIDFGIRSPFSGRRAGNFLVHFVGRYFNSLQKLHFRWVLRGFRPDLVHSLEFQLSGSMCAEEKLRSGQFPRWIATNWGSDIFLFRRLPWAAGTVKKILSLCDVYSCECERDVHLARELGFEGPIWPVMPNTGGFDLQMIETIRQKQAVSPRNIIMLKGYQSWSGRALFAIEALKRVSRELKGYKVMVFSWNNDVRIAIELASQDYGIDYELVPTSSSHDEILSYMARARIYLGVGISDGVSTSCLEAMAMGAFPIQSKGACCTEWFRNNESGMQVDGENIDEMEAALRRALNDDAMCLNAQSINWEIVKSRLDYSVIKEKVIRAYRESHDGLTI